MSFVSAALSRWWASAGFSLEVKSLTRASGQFSCSSILALHHFFSHQEEGGAASETLPYRAESRFRASKRRVWVSRRKGITSLLKVSSTSFLGKKAPIHGTAFSRLLLHCFLTSFCCCCVANRYVSDPETKYKCTESSDGSWFCERLDKTIANPKRRYILAASIKDHSGIPQHPPLKLNHVETPPPPSQDRSWSRCLTTRLFNC